MFVLYIDPGTGSMLISATIALFSVLFFMLKGVIYRKFSLGGDKGESFDVTKHYPLVFYSEGKQYWNVFKPLVEESNRRENHAIYLTSDKEDPALQEKYEYIETIYIGSGREAFYILNRLNADVVVLTTPGLDVLELKRSKNVKHYIHITHSAGGMATYKSYGTDYFDSVLVGGSGDCDIIRELESKRNIKKKEIEIIGHTYVDVMRQSLENTPFEYTFFEEKRPTILLSPTWGNHGLLMRVGDELLSKLEETDKYNVIIRPHPQSFISEKELMDTLMAKYPDNEHRVWNRDVQNLNAMSHADIMISDFSGIIYDFYALFKKPILTMTSQLEKRGRDAMDLDGESWEIIVLDKIGQRIDVEDIPNLPTIIEEAIKRQASNDAKTLPESTQFPNEAGVRGMNFIIKKLKETQTEAVSDSVTALPQSTVLNDDFTLNINSSEGGNWFVKTLKALFNPMMLLQITMGSALFVGYTYLGKKILPAEGLNQLFLIRILPYTVLATIALVILFILSTWILGKGSFTFHKEHESFDWKDLFLIALPLTPIIQYIVANQDILSTSDSLRVFGYFALISAGCIMLIPWILSTVVAKNVSTTVTMAYLFLIFNMASFGRVTPKLKIILIIAAIAVAIFFILFYGKKKLLIVISLIFFGTNAVTSMMKGSPNEVESVNVDTSYSSRIAKNVEGMEVQRTPDIFILIYDAYSNQETISTFGFDNSDQMNYLLDNGFAIYDGSYSVGAYSLSGIGHLLNPEEVPENSTEFRRLNAGDASMVQEVDKLGYYTEFVVDSDYMNLGFPSKYDYTFPDNYSAIAPHKIIEGAILEGEFRFDVDFSNIEFSDFLNSKEQILTQKIKKPEFLYSHVDYPSHSQNSGVLLPNETEIHIERFKVANEQMRNDIEAIKSKNRDAIIVIAGDHGPYLTKTGRPLENFDISEIDRLDIQDRYGAFLAIHWPDKSYATKFDIRLVQDAMPAALAYMYDDPSLFEKLRMEKRILYPEVIGGARVEDGIIHGGINDGEPLFFETGVRVR